MYLIALVLSFGSSLLTLTVSEGKTISSTYTTTSDNTNLTNRGVVVGVIPVVDGGYTPECVNGRTPNFNCGAEKICECDDCLAGDGTVKIAGGNRTKTVAELEVGDVVLAMDSEGHVVESEIYIIAHSSRVMETLFTVIWTEYGEKISLTPHHLIPVQKTHGSEPQFIFAENVKANNYIYVRPSVGNEAIAVKVQNVTTEIQHGFYSPITYDGTIIVNNIIVSCYARINNHLIAHVGLAPLRWFHAALSYLSIKEKIFEKKVSDTCELNWSVGLLYNTARTFLPQLFST